VCVAVCIAVCIAMCGAVCCSATSTSSSLLISSRLQRCVAVRCNVYCSVWCSVWCSVCCSVCCSVLQLHVILIFCTTRHQSEMTCSWHSTPRHVIVATLWRDTVALVCATVVCATTMTIFAEIRNTCYHFYNRR